MIIVRMIMKTMMIIIMKIIKLFVYITLSKQNSNTVYTTPQSSFVSYCYL